LLSVAARAEGAVAFSGLFLPLSAADFRNSLSYHVFSFRGSVQDYKIHMDMEIVLFAEEVKK
jgi:hypothetical protein